MIAIIGLVLSTIGNVFPSLFAFLGKQTDAQLAGFQTATSADAAAYQAYLTAQTAANATKASQWIGFKILASFAIEISLIYYGRIVWVSIFHDGVVDKMPGQWDTAAWVIIQSVIIVTPTIPVWNAVSSWLNRK